MQMLQQVVYPLHEACATNDLETVASLLKTGPGTSNGLMTFDVDAQDFEGWTPLHAAIQRGHVEVVRKLLGARCKIDATHWNMALEQLRPHEAHSTFARVVKVLQQHAYPMHFACAKGLTEDVDQLLRQNLDVKEKDWKGRTPLHEASKKGHMTLAQKLLAAGADMNAKDGKGCSPCHLAVIWAELDGTSAQKCNGQILSMFQQFGASIMEEMLSYGKLRLQEGEIFLQKLRQEKEDEEKYMDCLGGWGGFAWAKDFGAQSFRQSNPAHVAARDSMSFSMLHSSMLPPHDHHERDDRDSASSSASDLEEEDASDIDKEDERLCAIWGRPEHDNYPEEASDSDSSDEL